ncbi:MAG: phosphohistidine phosphatase [Verrucomicrobiota bacterium]|jgi:phosphohistidine phosphatase
MLIYFLRHGEADWPDWKKSDDERPLTEKGKAEMHEVGAFLANLSVKPDAVLTSPLPRASQTAEIAARYLDAKCDEDDLLAPGFGRAELKKLLKKRNYESVMVVGHEPDFSEAVGKLTGARVKLSKAGIALVEVDPDLRCGKLLWLFPPKIAKH